jgi:RNA polymerase sigma-70 factor (ECF subfamily)
MARAAAPTRSGVRHALAHAGARPLEVELAELLNRAASGDTDAYAAFYDATSPLVYGLVLTVVRSRSDADRVVKDIYLDLWRRPDLLTGRLTLLTALLCLTQRRAVQAARQDVPEGARVPEAPLAGVPTKVSLRRAVSRRQRLSLPRATSLPARQLTPLQQEILVLSYLGGYTVRQVSALLSLPTASVKDALTGALLGLAAPRPALLP